jgi:YgiT-type zinc finger domain-containing protein
MKCVICKQGHTKQGYTSVTLERDDMVCVIKHVPAEVCSNCEEAYLNSKTTHRVMEMANLAFKQGVQIEIRQFNAA